MLKQFLRIFNIVPTPFANGARRWFEVKNVSEKVFEVLIYDEIGGWGVSARNLVDQISAIPEKARIKVRIFSPGGDVMEGNEIYNALKAHKGGVDVEIGAMCCSIATVIACAGETITMAKNGLFMIHNPWTFVMGDSEDLRRMASVMDKMKSNIVDAYQGRTKLAPEALTKLMDDESWFTAEEARDKGFVDTVIEDDPAGDEVKDRFDLGRFKNSAAAISRLPKKAPELNPPAGGGNANQPAGTAKTQKQKPKTKIPTLSDQYKAGQIRVFAQ